MLKNYLQHLQDILNLGDAREESFYKVLESLLLDFAGQAGKKVDVTILPKSTEAGNPDFRVWDGKNHITGYIEAKDPSVTNLDRIENTPQLKRYRNTFPNLILTNFYEFRLYRNGDILRSVLIGRPVIAKRVRITPTVEKEDEFNELLNIFFSFSLPKVRNAKVLATELARRTRFLKEEVISIELEDEANKGSGAISGFYEAFQKYLIGTLNHESFADLYAQTITYGLFAARTRADGEFNRELAFRYIPHTIGILRDIFRFISLEDPPVSMKVIVDDISEVLRVTDVNQILRDFFHEGKGQDPIVHFYETFLSAYDPQIREKRGVYYTPEPVVRHIVHSINALLKSHFGMEDGLADERVTLLDPAAGTLTFSAVAVKTALSEFKEKYGFGGVSGFIKNHILKNFFAFELMMAPYAIGHLKMSFLLEEMGYKMADNDRFQLYLTNALEMDQSEQIRIPGLSSLSEESQRAGRIKKEQPILVILGNPPYSGHSANQNEWTERLLKDDFDGTQSYYKVDGKPLKEKNPKWLQDDYVKFIRFAQWKIQKAGQGIVGMITNHSYLDNPTFRGMRQSLMKTFNEIYLIDLHGNTLKKEISPDGSKDENVFDIRQGAAIVLMVKVRHKTSSQVFFKDLYGTREYKYQWLNENDLKSANYQSIEPLAPFYYFSVLLNNKSDKYLSWKSIPEIFPVNSVGVVTARDNFTIRWSEQEVWNTIQQFLRMDDEIAREAYHLGKDARDWKISLAKEDLRESGPDRTNIRPILYRPFDIRYTYFTGKSGGFICRPRTEVMQHMFAENSLGLITVRRSRSPQTWNLAFVTDKIISGSTAISALDINYLFPLYLIRSKPRKRNPFQVMMVFEPDAAYGGLEKIPNINAAVMKKLRDVFSENITPEQLLDYVYAILYTRQYRVKYNIQLKSDFPRIPFPSNYSVFKSMAAQGAILRQLHLMESDLLDRSLVKYEGENDNDRIEKIEFSENEKRIYINDHKYFEPIDTDLWNYSVGGYRVLQKFLLDRKGRIMDSPRHYCRIASALKHTISVQDQLEKFYPIVEDNLLDF